MATDSDHSKMDGKLERPRRPSAAEVEADDMLEGLGYTPELSRNRSTAQVAFMSFVLASIPYGLSTTLGYPLLGGGPVNVIWGWVAVSAIIVCVAASLGEITSVYPTAGGTTPDTCYFFFPPPG
jgi:amino acid permease